MLPRDPLSLIPVARTGAILPVADPRQQAFQRAFAGQLGQAMQAEVLSRVPDGSYVVRVGEMAARMALPPGLQPGAQVPLTLVAINPRPTFELTTSQGAQAFAEAGPPLPEGAQPQSAPLAYLAGKDAAPLARASALLAQTLAVAAPPGGATADGGAGARISTAGKVLGDVIAAAQKAAAQDGAPAAAVVGRTPLLAAPSTDGGRVAVALQDGLAKSGLFYESHVAEWAGGSRPLADLAAEPQARGMAPPSDPGTAQLINLQLSAGEQARVAWQGQLWPGQDLHWEVEREQQKQPQDGRSGAGDEGDAQPGWQSRLRLRFGALGEVQAQVVLSGGQLHIRLDAIETARARLEAGRARLAQQLDAAGTPLATLAIHGAPVLDGDGDGDGQGR